MADRQLRFVLSATDKGASSTLTGVASKAEGAGHRISGAFSKVGGIIGGEVGDALQGVADGFDKLSEHGMSMSQKLTAGGAALAGVGAGLTAMGDKEKAASQQLDQAITNTGHAAASFSTQIEDTVKHMESYGISAVTTKNALQTLTTATGDPTKALGLMGEAADLAAARHTDLTTAAGQLAKVVGGSGTKTLKAFGVELVKNADGTTNWSATNDVLAGKLKGQASAAADTLSGRFKALRTEVTDNVAAFGEKFGPTITGVGIAVMGLTPVVSGAANGIKALAARFGESSAAATAAAAETAAANVGVAASSVETAAVMEASAAVTQGTLFDVAAASVVSSDVVVGAADTEAAGVVAAGETARAGWMAALGPIGILVLGVGALAAVMMSSGSGAKVAADMQNVYTESLKKTTDALDGVNKASTNSSLSQSGELKVLNDLTAAGKNLGITTQDLTLAVNGSDKQFSTVTGTLKAAAAAQEALYKTAYAAGDLPAADAASALKDKYNGLATAVTELRKGLTDATVTQNQLNAANTDTSGGLDGLSARYGTVTSSLVAAKAAQDKTTASAKAATLQMQVENDAAGLLSAAFDKLNGVTLDAETANIAFKNAVHGLNQTEKDNGHQLGDNTVKGRANTQGILDAIKAAQAHAQAVGKQTGSTLKGAQAFDTDVAALKRHLIALGYNKTEIQNIIDKYAKLPKTKLTQIDINDAVAKAELKSLPGLIAKVKQGHVPTINIHTKTGMDALIALENKLYGLTHTSYAVTIGTTVRGSTSAGTPHAAGGLISGPGSGTSDSIPVRLSTGEYVINAAATSRNRAALDAMNAGGSPSGGGGSTTIYNNITINTPQIWAGTSPELGRVVAGVLERHVGRGGTVTIGRGVR